MKQIEIEKKNEAGDNLTRSKHVTATQTQQQIHFQNEQMRRKR